MANFTLSTDKQLVIRGGVVSLKAGDVETDDKVLINALEKAEGVESVKPKKTTKPAE